jgi:hypothetical protein
MDIDKMIKFLEATRQYIGNDSRKSFKKHTQNNNSIRK